MDQDSTKGPEKRNWREKLGIGTNGAGKDLPKIGDDFQRAAPKAPAGVITAPEPVARPAATPARPGVAAKPAVRPAPMAPRPAAGARPAIQPVPPDKLAERLRSQRDASARMAEQRVQVAKQKSEIPAAKAPVPPPPAKPAVAAAPIVAKPVTMPAAKPAMPAAAPAGPKPKFSFAEDDEKGQRPPAPAQQPQQSAQQPQQPMAQQAPVRPASFQPPPTSQPGLAPSRPALGAGAQGFPQRPVQPQQPPGFPPPTGQPYGQQGYPSGYGGQGASAIPPVGYRPIDPATGYPQQPYGQGFPPPGFNPQGRPAFNPGQRPLNPPPQGYTPPGSGPRLAVPPRPGVNPNYVAPEADAFNTPPPGKGPSMRPPPRAGRQQDQFTEFEDEGSFYEDPGLNMPRPAGRRPTTTDYQEAYRDVESGYDDEPPRSSLPWILSGILVIGALLAGGLVWWYITFGKPAMNGGQTSTNTEVPVVQPPAQANRTQPDQAQQNNAESSATRKQIYDRIVGDREVLGGQITPTEEVPQPGGAEAVPQPSTGTGEAAPAAGDAAPLPIPPPPGDNTQGALPDAQPGDPNKQSAENVQPAASESQAAVAIPAPGDVPQSTPPADGNSNVAAIPAAGPAETPAATADVPAVPGETKTASNVSMPPPAAADAQQEDVVTDKPSDAPKLKKVAATKPKAPAKPAQARLGSKPVVLVPPSKKRQATTAEVAVNEAAPAPQAADDSAGLYGTKYIVDAPAEAANTPAQASAPAKKKRTLADLFQNSGEEQGAAITSQNTAQTTPVEQPVVPSRPAAAKPAPVQVASAAPTGIVAQLASFKTRPEATAEFARLKARNAATLGGLSPIITQADVGGTTRYRLAVGPFPSRDAANALCSKLFQAGERDCLVKN